MITAKGLVTSRNDVVQWLGGNAVRIFIQFSLGSFMMSSAAALGVQALIESYPAAFERLDAAATADHFAYQSYIASDAEEVALNPIFNRRERVAAVTKVIVLHRELGAPSGRIHDLSILSFLHASCKLPPAQIP
jgi:hypothetical protein